MLTGRMITSMVTCSATPQTETSHSLFTNTLSQFHQYMCGCCAGVVTRRSTLRSTPPDPTGSSSSLASLSGHGSSPGNITTTFHSPLAPLHLILFSFHVQDVTSPPQLPSVSRRGLSPASAGWRPPSLQHWWSARRQGLLIIIIIIIIIITESKHQKQNFWVLVSTHLCPSSWFLSLLMFFCFISLVSV